MIWIVPHKSIHYTFSLILFFRGSPYTYLISCHLLSPSLNFIISVSHDCFFDCQKGISLLNWETPTRPSSLYFPQGYINSLCLPLRKPNSFPLNAP